MKEFIKNLNNEAKRLRQFVQTVYTGTNLQNELVDELNTRIMAHKLQVVGEKIQAYYEPITLEPDIPEFMKPKNQQVKEIVKLHLLNLIKSGRLDEFYYRALEDEKEQ